ncbi:hypothetical protein BDN71DRAFT_1438703 [Pleurotus eryngii]|uniref:Zinc-finger domain-containing protein n=1 Tax=Pleurotus eryngii TaxID=5323 RepID=A0A9P6DCR1_PLEER|nr:hypothetical protein BDN71DRAFT_1438703 [Pleurotus eryngii]
MSASNPKGSLPASYRFKEVYVDIPPSPYHTPRASKLSIGPRTGSAIIPSVRLKNSNSTRVSTQQTPISKRKLDNVPSVEIPTPSTKRAKLSSSATSLASLQSTIPAQNQENTAPGNVSSEFYCHQCNRKYNKEDAVDCFGVTAKGQCMAKYCKRCLINRYGENASHLKIAEARTYKCPRCRGVCNCSRCRKAQGLAPLGKMAPVGVNNVSTATNHGPSGGSIKDTKEKQTKAKSSTVQISSTSASGLKVQKTSSAVRKPKLKALPSLKWKAVPTDLNYEQALLRFEIREFVLRFGILFPFPVSKSHMEELNAVEGKHGSTGDEEDYEPLHGWVSEGCVKSIIIGLLGFLVDDKHAAVAKAIKLAMKDIRSCGANLSKLWAVLARLRDILGRDAFPDPLPGPEVSVRMTRNTHVDEAQLLSVAFAAQLVPVIVALQEATLTSSRIRKEIDEGVQSSKDMMREAREASKKEAERWEQQQKDVASDATGGKEATLKAARQEHKQHLQKLDGMTKILSHAYTPRSGYLGQDAEGRTYWALSPGMPEREEALTFLEACKEVEGKGKKAKGRRSVPSVVNGEELEDWSWFVAVWGSEPRNAGAKSKPDDEDAWWGIWEPAEIRKLSQWLTIKYRLDEEDESPAAKDIWWAREDQKTIKTNSLPSKHELESLVKGLDEYATVLQWRIEKARDEA